MATRLGNDWMELRVSDRTVSPAALIYQAGENFDKKEQ